jgi:hypothetical protein
MTRALLYCSNEPFTVRRMRVFSLTRGRSAPAFSPSKGQSMSRPEIDKQAGISLVVGVAGGGNTMLLEVVENALASEGRPALLRIPKWDSGADLLAWLLGELGQDRSGARGGVGRCFLCPEYAADLRSDRAA